MLKFRVGGARTTKNHNAFTLVWTLFIKVTTDNDLDDVQFY